MPNRNIVAYESVWSIDVVIGESSKYSRSFTCIHWVGLLSFKNVARSTVFRVKVFNSFFKFTVLQWFLEFKKQ